jgi:regulator of chromosome condensation
MLTVLRDIFASGIGEHGQLGCKVIAHHRVNGTIPEKIILGNSSKKAIMIGAGHDQSFTVDNQGVVWGLGLNSMGQIGVGADMGSLLHTSLVHTPKTVIGLSKKDLGGAEIEQICGKEFFTLFLSSDGKVYTCGSRKDGRLGLANNVIEN